MAKCKGCGEEIAEGVTFCPKCGVRQNENSDREKNVDKLVANAASISDDAAALASDAYSVVKFGKKVGKATIKEVTEKKEGASLKSRVVAAVLAFFLGWTGVHEFYLGKKLLGVIHFILLVLVFACMIPDEEDFATIGMFLICINPLWAVMEALLLLFGCGKDGSGKPVKNWS